MGDVREGARAGDRRQVSPGLASRSTLLWGNLLCMDEHVLLEVLPPHKQLVTIVTLEVLLTRVDNHVRLQVSLLGERLVTQSTPVVLLTCTLTHIITRNKTPISTLKTNRHTHECAAEAGVKQNSDW